MVFIPHFFSGNVIGKRFTDGRFPDSWIWTSCRRSSFPNAKRKKMLNYIRVHLYLLKNISKRMLEEFGNGLVTRNEYRIYKELKENGEVQNLRQSKDTESFEWCMKEVRPLLELYEEFEQLYSNPEEYLMATYCNLNLDITQTQSSQFN